MKTEPINAGAQAEMERQLGCRFCPDGRFAEMSLPLADYREQTAPIPGVSFGFYTGEPAPLQALVAQVDDSWCRYYTDTSAAFCAWVDGQVVSFCLVDTDAACILSLPGLRVGSIGCVGTLPAFRPSGAGASACGWWPLPPSCSGRRAVISPTSPTPPLTTGMPGWAIRSSPGSPSCNAGFGLFLGLQLPVAKSSKPNWWTKSPHSAILGLRKGCGFHDIG